MIQTSNSVGPTRLNDSSDSWVLVDVRTPAEFRASAIAGSTNLPLGDMKRWAPELARLAGDRPVALVCRTGRRAEEARRRLATSGVELAVLDGGVVAWAEAGLPLECGPGRPPMSVERQVRVASGIMVLIGVTLGIFVHPGFLGLAAFVGAGQIHAGLTDTCGMAMLLARMPWNRGAICEIAAAGKS